MKTSDSVHTLNLKPCCLPTVFIPSENLAQSGQTNIKRVMPFRDRLANTCRPTLVIAALLLACVGANAAIIFQADFNGTNNGTGGVDDMATVGGSGRVSGIAPMVVTMTAANPFTSLSGKHLNFSAASAVSVIGTNGCPVTFDFNSPSNSFKAWQRPNIHYAPDNINCVNLRGAFDCFFRKNSSSGGSFGSLMRPINLDGVTSWTGNFLQARLTGNGANYAPEITLANPASLTNADGSIINFFTNLVTHAYVSGSATLSQTRVLLLSSGGDMQNGVIYHLGIAFDTDTNGIITFTTYRRVGTGPIDTKADVLSVAQFRLNADKYGPLPDPGTNAFLSAPFGLNTAAFVSGISYDMDYDTVRIYDSVPAVFEGLPGTPVLPPQSGLVFEADFNGSGGGTGGGSDVVAVGGTGALNSDPNITTSIIIPSDPLDILGVAGGNYLNSLVNPGHGAQTSPSANFTFATNANSFAAWQGCDIVGVGTNYTRLHGGFDMFFRPNFLDDTVVTGDSAWFRPITMTSAQSGGQSPGTGTGGGNLSLLFAGGGGASGISVSIVNGRIGWTNDPVMFINFSNTVGEVVVYTNDQVQIRGGDIVTAGTNVVYHAGFTLNTATGGVTTLNIYLKQGTNAIDTTVTNDLVASASFKINAAMVGPDAFVKAPWVFEPSGLDSANGANFDVDSVRLYDAAPTSFRALGAPLPAPLPGIASVSPTNGTTSGGTAVTINGANFVSGMTVKFGNASATGVTFINSTQVTAVTPAGAAGMVDVTAQNPDTQTGTLFCGFTYVVPVALPPGFLPPTVSGGNINLSWTNSGTLLWSTNVSGPWVTNTSATSPFSEAIVPTQNRFYRLQAP